MEKQRQSCQNCGEIWDRQQLHHSKAQETLCNACFRLILKKTVEDDVKAQCQHLRDHISTLLLPTTPTEVAIQQAEIATKRLALDIQKAKLVQEQHTMDNLSREIEDLNTELCTLTTERIYKKYRLNCVFPLDQIRLVLCTECTLRLEAGPVRRLFAQNTESEGQTQLVEGECCSAKCSCM